MFETIFSCRNVQRGDQGSIRGERWEIKWFGGDFILYVCICSNLENENKLFN